MTRWKLGKQIYEREKFWNCEMRLPVHSVSCQWKIFEIWRDFKHEILTSSKHCIKPLGRIRIKDLINDQDQGSQSRYLGFEKILNTKSWPAISTALGARMCLQMDKNMDDIWRAFVSECECCVSVCVLAPCVVCVWFFLFVFQCFVSL